jgi:DNA-binding MarR family transcriptional regulator
MLHRTHIQSNRPGSGIFVEMSTNFDCVSMHQPLPEPGSAQAAQRLALNMEIGRSVATAFIYLEALDRHTLSRVQPPLTPAQYHALAALERTPCQTLGALAETLLCDKGNASGIMDRLEALGLAERSRDTADRRRVALSLTPAGVQALAEARCLRTATMTTALATIDFDELSAIHERLARLSSTLEAAVSGNQSRSIRTVREGDHFERANEA